MLIYNGDHDLCVPHTGAEAWTRSLALPPLGAWRPWLADGQARPVLAGSAFALMASSGLIQPVRVAAVLWVIF